MAIGAILGAVGAGMNLLSPLLSRKEQPDQINPYTDQRLKDLMASLAQYEPQFNALGGQAQSNRRQVEGSAAQSRAIGEESRNVKGPSANAWFDQFLENIPEYQAVAEEVSRMSTERLGRDITERGRIRQEQAIRAAQDATAGQGFSGAAAQAVGQAAAQPIADAGLQADQMAADIYNQTFQNLGGQGQQIAYQDQQMQYQNALSSLAQALQGSQTAGNMFANAGNIALQGQSNIGGYMGNIQNNIQDITQPVYSGGQTVNPMGDAGNSIAALGQFLGAMQKYPSMYNDPVKGQTGSTFGGR